MELTLVFLLIALVAYTLLGGADFGGGILEATLGRYPHLQQRIQDSLAPIWEANHVWLIAVVVILFVGFPAVYAELCTVLFVPLSLALLGIILRGAFFTFRKYDPEPDPRRRFYSVLFRLSSMLTPLMYGMIVASLLRPFPSTDAAGGLTFADAYLRPWATLHGIMAALFVYCLFGYVAAVFLYARVDSDRDRAVVRKRIGMFFGATFITGGLVLGYGAWQEIVPLRDSLNPIQIAAQAGALLCIPLIWSTMKGGRIWSMRLLAGAQVLCIQAGWFATQYPVFLRFDDGRALTIYNSSAPDITLFWLNLGLAVVLAVVLPLLAYLYRVFAGSHHH